MNMFTRTNKQLSKQKNNSRIWSIYGIILRASKILFHRHEHCWLRSNGAREKTEFDIKKKNKKIWVNSMGDEGIAAIRHTKML